jgi:DNA-binding NarL/FixJ family response regulator
MLLIGVEVLTEDEPVELADFLGDALQTALVVASSVGVAMLVGRFQSVQEQREGLTRDLRIARAEGEVGLLMLKGFTHGEAASLRGTPDATVRHQARAIYQKSNLPGRTAFCAYFLEDLLPARGLQLDGPRSG